MKFITFKTFLTVLIAAFGSQCNLSPPDSKKKDTCPISNFIETSGVYLTDSVQQVLSDTVNIQTYEYQKTQSNLSNSKSIRTVLKPTGSIRRIASASIYYFPNRVIVLNRWVLIFFDLGMGNYIDKGKEFVALADGGSYSSLLIIGDPLSGRIIKLEYGGNRLCNQPFGHYDDIVYKSEVMEWSTIDYFDSRSSIDRFRLFLNDVDSIYRKKHEVNPYDEVRFQEISCEELILDSILD